MNILAIESAGQQCSVAVSVDGVIYQQQVSGVRAHTQSMLVFIEQVLAEAHITLQDLSAIAFSAGPGSFTGVRLASSVAKTLAYALDIPIYAVDTLAAVAWCYLQNNTVEKSLTVISDAKMQQVYMASYKLEGDKLQTIKVATCVDVDDCKKQLANLGDTVVDCAQLLDLPNDNQWQLSAAAILALAPQQQADNALDVQPAYVRDKTAWKNTEQQQAGKH